MKNNMYQQPPPILRFAGHQSNLIMKECKHRPLDAHRRDSSLRPHPHNIVSQTSITQNEAMLAISNNTARHTAQP